MLNNRFEKLLFIGFVDFQQRVFMTKDLRAYEEIGFYFGQKYRDKPGTLIFINKRGNIRAVKVDDLSLEEKAHFCSIAAPIN